MDFTLSVGDTLVAVGKPVLNGAEFGSNAGVSGLSDHPMPLTSTVYFWTSRDPRTGGVGKAWSFEMRFHARRRRRNRKWDGVGDVVVSPTGRRATAEKRGHDQQS